MKNGNSSGEGRLTLAEFCELVSPQHGAESGSITAEDLELTEAAIRGLQGQDGTLTVTLEL